MKVLSLRAAGFGKPLSTDLLFMAQGLDGALIFDVQNQTCIGLY